MLFNIRLQCSYVVEEHSAVTVGLEIDADGEFFSLSVEMFDAWGVCGELGKGFACRNTSAIMLIYVHVHIERVEGERGIMRGEKKSERGETK